MTSERSRARPRDWAVVSVRSPRGALVTVILWVLLTACAPALAPRLASVETNRGVNDPPASAQSMRARALLAKAFPAQRGTPAIIVVRDPHGLGSRGEREIRRIIRALTGARRPPGIGAPVSPVGAGQGGRALLARDGTTAQIVVPVLGSSSEDRFGEAVDAVRAAAGSGRDGLQIAVTGPAGIARDTVKAFRGANLVLLFGTVALVLVLLLAIYRAPVLALVPLVAVSIALELTNALGASLVKAGAFSVSSQAASIMTVLLFGIGTDYCLFIVARHREELRSTRDRYAAMRATMRKLLAPLLSSAATVVLAPDRGVAALDVIYRGNPYDNRALDRAARLRETVAATLNGTALRDSRALVGGESAASLDLRSANDRDLRVVSVVTIAIIALVLVLLLRSLIAPLYLVATTLAAFAATLGLTVFCVHTLGGDDGMGVRVTIYIFVFLIALGVDYNILLTSRIREETRAHGPVDPIRLAVARSGAVISSAGIILAGTFAVLMTQPIDGLFQFGFAMTTGLLLDTFLIRGALVPAIARLLGDRNWWPGRPPPPT